MRKFRIFLIVLGIVIIILDYVMTKRGTPLCPFEGCHVVMHSSFSQLLGLPLRLWGLLFFLVALFIVGFDRIFNIWVFLGTGFALYMVFLQIFVLEKICELCIFIETLVFILFLTTLNNRNLHRAAIGVISAFFITHALYTFPPPSNDTKVIKTATWKGKGNYQLDFFFDPNCPACEKAFEVLNSSKDLIKTITFRCIAIHKGSTQKALEFYRLCEKGISPWNAFKSIHEGKLKTRPFNFLFVRYKSIVNDNLKFLLFLRSNAIPTLFVREKKKALVLVGAGEIKDWLEKNKKTADIETQIFTPLDSGVCTPKGCE